MFRPFIHDDGIKTVLGQSGRFDGDAVLDILLAQPQTAEFVVNKMWREFVSPDPDPTEVKRIARIFRDNRYNIKVAMHALLTSDAFYAQENRAVLTKSPVDLIVGTLRQFRFETGDVTPFVLASRQLGQDLFGPPNVKGWPGGEAWINSATLLQRKQLLARLLRDQELNRPMMAPTGGVAAMKSAQAAQREMSRADINFDSVQWLSAFKPNDPLLIKVVLAAPPVTPPGTAQDVDELRQLVLDPVYELK